MKYVYLYVYRQEDMDEGATCLHIYSYICRFPPRYGVSRIEGISAVMDPKGAQMRAHVWVGECTTRIIIPQFISLIA